MNYSTYLIKLLDLFKNQKKRPHICGAGWWGTLFLNQFLKKCNPLSVAQILPSKYTTDSALIIFMCKFINPEIILLF